MRGKKRPADERIRALSLAVVRGVPEASQQTGIPERTIRLWTEQPEYAELRRKTGEQLAEGFLALAHLAMGGLMDAIEAHQVEPRDLAIALGVATDKHLLMNGQATGRTETRDLTKRFDDHELTAIRDFVDRLDGAAGTGDAGVEASPAEADRAEVR